MKREDIVRLINSRINSQNLEVSSLSVSSHTHNGADSQQIQSSSLFPYPTDFTVFTIPQDSPDGTIRYYNFANNNTPSYDWGEFIWLNNQLNILALSDVSLSSSDVSQTISDGNTDTIIFQTLYNESPNGAYNDTTGVFSSVNNVNGIPMTYDGWFLVTSNILLDSGTAGGTFTISIVANGVSQSSVTYQGSAESFTLQISQALHLFGINTIEIQITNNSGNSRDVIGGLAESRLQIKQLK